MTSKDVFPPVEEEATAPGDGAVLRLIRRVAAQRDSLPSAWLILCVTVVPCLFYLPSLDYLNLPREIFWIMTGLVLMAWQLFSGRLRPLLSQDRLGLCLAILLGWALLSSLWAWQPHLAWLRWTLLAAAFYTFCLARVAGVKTATAVLWVLALQGLLGSIVGFVQWMPEASFGRWLGAEPFLFIRSIRQTEIPGITMGHRNVAAEYILITLGATAALLSMRGSWLRSWKSAPDWLLRAGLLAQLGLLYIIMCRGVILGIAVSGMAFLLLLLWERRNSFTPLSGRFRLAAAAVLLCAALAVGIYFLATGRVPLIPGQSETGKLVSTKMRLAHYSNTLVLTKDHLPEGVGLGNFALIYTSYLNAWVPDVLYTDKLLLRNTHSDPLECLAELGPIGLAIALYCAWLLLVRVPSSDARDRILKWTIFAQLVNSCVNFPFQIIQTQLAMAALAGLLASGKTVGKARTLPYPGGWLIKAFAIVLIAFYAKFQWKRLSSQEEALFGLELMVAKKQPQAEPHLRRAVELTPRDVETVMLLAYCLRETGFYTESSSRAENVLGMFPGYLPAINLIGLNALDKNDLNRAMRAFETSFRLQPHQDATRRKLAITYRLQSAELRRNGDIEHAFMAEAKLSRLYPEQLDSHYLQVLDLLTLERPGDAAAVFGRIAPQEKDPRYYYLGARVALAEKNAILAAERVEKGLEINPEDPELLKLREVIAKGGKQDQSPAKTLLPGSH